MTDNDSDMACERHDLEELPTGHDHCPMCVEEQRVEEQQMEMLARRADPNMHPTVDAPANAIDHSRRPEP